MPDWRQWESRGAYWELINYQVILYKYYYINYYNYKLLLKKPKTKQNKNKTNNKTDKETHYYNAIKTTTNKTKRIDNVVWFWSECNKNNFRFVTKYT